MQVSGIWCLTHFNNSVESLVLMIQRSTAHQNTPSSGSTTRKKLLPNQLPGTAMPEGCLVQGQSLVWDRAAAFVTGNYVSKKTTKGCFIYTPPTNYCLLAIGQFLVFNQQVQLTWMSVMADTFFEVKLNT